MRVGDLIAENRDRPFPVFIFLLLGMQRRDKELVLFWGFLLRPADLAFLLRSKQEGEN